MNTLRIRAAAAIVAAVLVPGAATADSTGASAASACDAKPTVEQFMEAFTAGDLGRLDGLFAQAGERWGWYSVSDRAGRRLGAESKSRDSLVAYFASRIRQNESLHLVSLREGGNGNFGLVLTRRVDDLREGRPVERVGKGWVNCAVGKIAVWSLGGARPPRTFGPCPQGTLPLARADLAAAARAVLRFVDDVYSEMAPGLDVAGVRVKRVAPAPGNVKGYAARVKCGQSVQQRTAIVDLRFPRVAPREQLSTVAFYVSRVPGGWLVWRLLP